MEPYDRSEPESPARLSRTLELTDMVEGSLMVLLFVVLCWVVCVVRMSLSRGGYGTTEPVIVEECFVAIGGLLRAGVRDRTDHETLRPKRPFRNRYADSFKTAAVDPVQ